MYYLVHPSINRCAATLRHFATWLHKEKPLPAGHPYTGVKDLVTDEPVWNGLTTQQILLLKSACDIRMATCTKKNQNPLFDAAIFYVLLNTGLREFELASLTLSQYNDRAFYNIKRKGKKITRRMGLPSEAKERLDAYLMDRFSEIDDFDIEKVNVLFPDEPLFLTRNGRKLSGRTIQYVTERLSIEASKNLPLESALRVSPHQLRHTFLKHVADKHGVHVAQNLSGNISMKEVWRYTKASEDEKDNITENLYR